MTDRDRLVELLKDTLHEWECDVSIKTLTEIAEHLISNGVIVPPCKVGDTVYHLYPKQGIKSNKVKRIQVGTYGMMIADRNGVFRVDEINKTVFLNREEAEKALKENKRDEN